MQVPPAKTCLTIYCKWGNSSSNSRHNCIGATFIFIFLYTRLTITKVLVVYMRIDLKQIVLTKTLIPKDHSFTLLISHHNYRETGLALVLILICLSLAEPKQAFRQ